LRCWQAPESPNYLVGALSTATLTKPRRTRQPAPAHRKTRTAGSSLTNSHSPDSFFRGTPSPLFLPHSSFTVKPNAVWVIGMPLLRSSAFTAENHVSSRRSTGMVTVRAVHSKTRSQEDRPVRLVAD